MRVEVDIDEKEFIGVCRKERFNDLVNAVQAIYGKLWCEACYDPYNEQTQKMARELLPHIEMVKSILHIKKQTESRDGGGAGMSETKTDSQSPVKWTAQSFLKDRPTTLHSIPVVPLSALRVWLKRLDEDMQAAGFDAPTEAQHLLASLGEIQKQDSGSSKAGRTLSTAELPGMTLQETIDAQRKA